MFFVVQSEVSNVAARDKLETNTEEVLCFAIFSRLLVVY
jgi:hypothetical protein